MESLNRQHRHAVKFPERVLQFGEGNFMRAFVDWQIDVLNKQAGFNTGVVIVQPLPTGLAEGLNAQDGLYTLYLEGIKDGEAVREHTVVECVSRAINPYEQHEAYEQLAAHPELKFIFSNTTEAGIAYAPEDKLEDRPQQSFPGKLTALLYRRYKHFQGDVTKGFIIIPCELIDRNGEELKKIVLEYAGQWQLEEGFIRWLNEANTFCCSLVDRIVPGYPKDRIGEITKELGYEDKFVVVGEQFHLWVIEGPAFVKEAFPAAAAGLNVLVVNDLTPYRTRKVRILNGAHTAMTPVAYLYGIDTVREAVQNKVVGKFITSLIHEEIIPTLELPEEELRFFADAVMERFNNPYVEHYLMSIALNSISKFKTRDLPSLLGYVDKYGKLPRRLVFSLAALIMFYKGKRGAKNIVLADDKSILEWFGTLWLSYEGGRDKLERIADKVLGAEEYWGRNLNEVAGLNEQVAEYLYEIESRGMAQALEGLLAEQ